MTRVERLLNLAEYKRRQAAPGVKVTLKNFGRDRRYPIINRFRDTGKPLPAPDETLISRAGARLGGGVRRRNPLRHRLLSPHPEQPRMRVSRMSTTGLMVESAFRSSP